MKWELVCFDHAVPYAHFYLMLNEQMATSMRTALSFLEVGTNTFSELQQLLNNRLVGEFSCAHFIRALEYFR